MGEKMLKIKVCMPNTGMIHTHTVASLLRLSKEPYQFSYNMVISSCIAQNRNDCVQDALDDDVDYILWVDSDMTFNPDDLKQLLADDKDIVTGLYFTRKQPVEPVIYSMVDDGEYYTSIKDYYKNTMFKVGGCGSGFVLVKTDVYRKIKKDWYSIIGNIGEDLSFCKRALQTGYDIYCDTTVKLGHVGTHIYTESDFGE